MVRVTGKSRRAIIFGAAGQIGRAMVHVLANGGYQTDAYDHVACDIKSLEAVLERAAGLTDDDVLVNAAAWTDVVASETDPNRALESNARGCMNLALASAQSGATCVCFSTDYVFDGTKASPYVESDAPNPVNVYGATKLAGEIFTRAIAPRHYIARVATVFGVAPGRVRPNFVDRVAGTAKGSTVELIAEGSISPTYASDAADLVGELIERQAPYGVYHLANGGVCTWYELGVLVNKLCGTDATVRRAVAGPVGPVRRPLYSALASEKLHTLGLTPKPWRDALVRYLRLMRLAKAAG